MFGLSRNRVPAAKVASILALLTNDICTNFPAKVFPGVQIPNRDIVLPELRYLAIYITDSYLKADGHEPSWAEHRFHILNLYEAEVARTMGIPVAQLLQEVGIRHDYYATRLGFAVSLFPSNLDPSERGHRIAATVGEDFAEACGDIKSGLFKMMGVGAFVAVQNQLVNITTKFKVTR